MWYPIQSYFKFLWESTNRHGVHSPFVYDLVTKCFNDKTKHPQYQRLNGYRGKVLQCEDKIHVTDLGTGSRVFLSQHRPVSRIAKYAGITKKRQRLLFRLVRYFQPNRILELGTSLGLSTIAMALGNEDGKVISIEGCPETAKKASEFFNFFDLKNIELQQCAFKSYLDNSNVSYDLVFIDGDHNFENTLYYFNKLLSRVTNNSILIFDDIYWSPDMTKAWNEICNHPGVTASIDIYYWGIVFFRQEQQKEHFIIRM